MEVLGTSFLFDGRHIVKDRLLVLQEQMVVHVGSLGRSGLVSLMIKSSPSAVLVGIGARYLSAAGLPVLTRGDGIHC